ncbi:DNA-binding protein HEXBP-like [Portunus trituberculatus]|uniref:DNA-binding protein HEXBP-like n=1 Tax=Portunus trituberculatus TaxID=210409 RepID=UPI001E1CB81B|nr:DNA-binding protein HEXBP-like [Portunus trituberculatus]
METLDLPQILARTRALVRDIGAGGVHEVCLGARAGNMDIGPYQRCFVCNGVNHFARDCLARQDTYSGRSQRSAGRTSRRGVRCYRCGVLGHIALACPGNDRGGEA